MGSQNNGNVSRVSFKPYDNPMQEYFDKHLQSFAKLVKIQPYDFLMVSSYEAFHDSHLSFPCRPTDVWVTSYPKAGTTWTQELVWSLAKGLSHPDGKKPLMNRFPFFEWDSLMTPVESEAMAKLPEGNVEKPGEQWKILDTDANPRFIKSHMHRQLLPRGVTEQKSKIIYVMRDPRDVCVSLYYHTIKFLAYSGDFDHFVDIFLNDLYEFGPFWVNVLSYWEARDRYNILFLRYEDMKQDLGSAINKVTKFLDLSIKNDQLPALIEHLSFATMKTNPATNNETLMAGVVPPSDVKFMRKGVVGDYKNHLSDTQLDRFKEWTSKWLNDSDFPYYRDQCDPMIKTTRRIFGLNS